MSQKIQYTPTFRCLLQPHPLDLVRKIVPWKFCLTTGQNIWIVVDESFITIRNLEKLRGNLLEECQMLLYVLSFNHILYRLVCFMVFYTRRRKKMLIVKKVVCQKGRKHQTNLYPLHHPKNQNLSSWKVTTGQKMITTIITLQAVQIVWTSSPRLLWESLLLLKCPKDGSGIKNLMTQTFILLMN